jgi:hypothetical protein
LVCDESIYRSSAAGTWCWPPARVMDRLFNTVVDRTRSWLEVPKERTLFGSTGRPHHKPGAELASRQAVVIEKTSASPQRQPPHRQHFVDCAPASLQPEQMRPPRRPSGRRAGVEGRRYPRLAGRERQSLGRS